MTRALQVISEHSQLRADTESDDIVIDEVDTNIFIVFSFVCALNRKMSQIIYVEQIKSYQIRRPDMTPHLFQN